MKRRIWILMLVVLGATAVVSCGAGRDCDCPSFRN